MRTVPDAPTAVERFSSLVHPFSASSGAYTGPFTQLSATALDGVADPDDGFGPEDKLVACNTNLVFVDLETDGTSADDTLISVSLRGAHPDSAVHRFGHCADPTLRAGRTDLILLGVRAPQPQLLTLPALTLQYSTKTQAWSRTKIISNGCPD